jgi:AbrB family looped-hinge helix DNA binding protein
MRITSKGQVTVPKHIREKLGLKPGDAVDFVEDGGKVRLVRSHRNSELSAADGLIAALEVMGQDLERIPMTTDELMQLTRGPFDDLDSH